MATDFQMIADAMEAATGVISVEVLDDGSCGEIRVVAGNKGYIDAIERPQADYKMRSDKFIPNSIYTDYVPRDLNFEDYCFRSAVQKKCLHSYVKPSQMPIWFNMTFLPIGPSEGNIHYCTYTMEVNFEASAERMSNISGELASQILEICLKLRGSTDFEKTVQEIIVDIRELCKADHCCLMLVDTYEKKCTSLGEAFAENTKLIPNGELQRADFYDIAASWEDLIGASNCIIAKDSRDMELVKERNPVWYESLTVAGIYNIVLFPLKSRDVLLGYIWAVNFDADQTLKIKEALELTTFVLGSEIGSHLLLDRLKILSSKDMLTGTLNRNEMNNLVDKLSSEDSDIRRSVGVIFADVNGLKNVNDEFGHNAGDILLKDAAKALEEVFPKDCIYRAGGDEFTVIMVGTTEEELKNKIEELRIVTTKYDRVLLAVGECVEDDFRNVRNALKIADQRMYEDKRLFYETHPDFKKRLS